MRRLQARRAWGHLLRELPGRALAGCNAAGGSPGPGRHLQRKRAHRPGHGGAEQRSESGPGGGSCRFLPLRRGRGILRPIRQGPGPHAYFRFPGVGREQRWGCAVNPVWHCHCFLLRVPDRGLLSFRQGSASGAAGPRPVWLGSGAEHGGKDQPFQRAHGSCDPDCSGRALPAGQSGTV